MLDLLFDRLEILDQVPIGIFVIDRNYIIRFWNSCLEDWTRIWHEDVLGTDIRNIYPNLKHEKYSTRFQDIFSSGTPYILSSQLNYGLFPVEKVTGELRIFRITLNPVPHPGSDSFLALAALEDITEVTNRSNELHKSLDEKKILIKEVHHRVKNNLSMIYSLMNLQEGDISDPHDQEVFRQLKKRIRSIAMVHEKLYKSNDLVHIDMREYIHDLVDNLLSSMSDESKGYIVCHYEIHPIELDIDHTIPLGLIITELVINTIKHAYPGDSWNRSKEISVTFLKEKEQYHFIYRDNGKGFSKNITPNKSHSLGIKLIDSLIKQLSGTSSKYNDQGAVYSFTLPC